MDKELFELPCSQCIHQNNNRMVQIENEKFEPPCSCCTFWDDTRDGKDTKQMWCSKVNRWVPDMVEEESLECPCFIRYVKEKEEEVCEG